MSDAGGTIRRNESASGVEVSGSGIARDIPEASPSSRLEDEMDEDSDFVEPVALLMDALKSEETAARIESVRRLHTIALALGPERTRNELIPFLLNSLDEEDEVLAAIAEELFNFDQYLGGQAYCSLLFPVLEGLASAEEPFVRTKAVASFVQLIERTAANELTQSVLPLVQRLAYGDWFSKKASATNLLAAVFQRAQEVDIPGDVREQLLDNVLNLFVSLGSDETPAVRKAVAVTLSRMLLICKIDEMVRKYLLPLVGTLVADPQDSVRQLAVEPLVLLFQSMTLVQEEKKTTLTSLFAALAGDSAWRVRLMVASHFGSLANPLIELATDLETDLDPLEVYCLLLRDFEAEVRMSAVTQLAQVAAACPSERVEATVIPMVQQLVTDPYMHVRSAVALQLNDLAQVVGPELASRHLIDLIMQLLRDQSSEVRLNVISKLEIIVSVIGLEKLSASLLPAIIALAEDPQWRVRQTIIEYVPELCQHLGSVFFDTQLTPLFVNWLGDSVFAVRETAVDSLKRLLRQFGAQWALGNDLLPQVLALKTHRNYLRRITLLQAIASIAGVLSEDYLNQQILPTLAGLVADPVPNIRFNVAKTLEAVIPILLASSRRDSLSSLVPLLQQLVRDADTDVQAFARRALDLLPVS